MPINKFFLSSLLSVYSIQRAYILKKELADLENALIKYTLDFLNSKVAKYEFNKMLNLEIKHDVVYFRVL